MLERICDDLSGLFTRHDFMRIDVTWVDKKYNIVAAFEHEDRPKKVYDVIKVVIKLKNLRAPIKCIFFWINGYPENIINNFELTLNM